MRLKLSKNEQNFILVVLIVFLIMFVFNYLTPLIADDYTYSIRGFDFRITQIRPTHFVEIFKYQVNHYFTWGGRSVVHTLAQIFLLFGKSVFNVLNSVIYVILTLLIYGHITGYKKANIWLYLMINALLWSINPVFGQTTLWLIGASNYLWGTSIILMFLLPFRLNYDRTINMSKWWNLPLFALLSLLAGWSNENTSGAGILLAVMFVAIHVFVFKRKLKVWMIVGILFACIGLALLVLAPGNAIRSEYFNVTFIDKLIKSFEMIRIYFIPYVFLFLFVLVCGYTDTKRMKDHLLSLIYFIGALACNFAMVMAPAYPERATHGFTSILIISIGCAYMTVKSLNLKQVLNFGISLLVVTLVFNMRVAFVDIYAMKQKSNQRVEDVLRERNMGNLNVSTFTLVPKTRFNGLYGLDDLQPGIDFWINVDFATFYGLETVRTVE